MSGGIPDEGRDPLLSEIPERVCHGYDSWSKIALGLARLRAGAEADTHEPFVNLDGRAGSIDLRGHRHWFGEEADDFGGQAVGS